MAKGEHDFEGTLRPRWIFFHQQKLETFGVFIYCHWDFHFLTKAAISVVFVKEKVKLWISKMVGSVIACKHTLHDDLVEPGELLRSKEQFSKYSNLLKRHAVRYEDDLFDIVQALRDPKQAWDTIYENLENAVLKHYMLKNVLLSDVEHCYFLNRPPYQHHRQANVKYIVLNACISISKPQMQTQYKTIKLSTSLHEELFKQINHIHRCFLSQGMQAVRDGLKFLKMKVFTSSPEEMLKHSDHGHRCFLRDEMQAVNDGLDILQGTPSKTRSTPSISKAETVSCLVAEDARTESVKERGFCFTWRFHRVYFDMALTTVLVALVCCLLCTPTCGAMDVDSKTGRLTHLFIWGGIKELYIDDVRQLVLTLAKFSLEDFYKQWTGICYYICRHEHQSSVYAFEENKTHTFEENCDFVIYFLHIQQETSKISWLDCKSDVWICTNECGTTYSLVQCLQQDGIKDLYIEDGRFMVFTLEEPSFEDFYIQWTGKCYYICRHEHQSSMYAHKSSSVFFKGNNTHTFEEDCDFGIYFLHIEQESGISSWLDGKTNLTTINNKCGAMCSPAQCQLQDFQQVDDEILQECAHNQPNSLLEMTNKTVKIISLKQNNDERTMDTEEKMKIPNSIDVFNATLIVWLVNIALSRIKLILFCVWISIKHVKLKSPNPITWIICKKHSPTTPDLAWFRGNSKLREDHRYKSIEVHKEVACLRKPVQEQTKRPESKPTVSIDTVCSETSEKFYSLIEKYVVSLPSIEMSLEESNELLITTPSIEADPNTEFVYDENCEIEIRKSTENNTIRNEKHTQNNAIKELEKSKNIPHVVADCNHLSSATKYGVENFYDLKRKGKLKLKVPAELPEKSFPPPDYSVIKEDVDSLTEKCVNAFDFDKFNAEKENPGRRRKRVDSTFSKKEFDQIRFLRDLTWLPLNQLPIPKVDLIIGFVPDFPPLMAIIDLIAIGKPPAPHVSMRYELLRFCTLRSYPKEDKPFLIKLAEAGFYYASDGDGVVCYCCGIRRYNWTADDYPMKIHRRINPTCKFLTKNEEVNVRNDFYGPFSKSLLYIDSIPEPRESQEPSEDINNDWAPERTRSPAPRPQSSQNSQSSSQLGINTAIPKHSQYATKPARIASFNGWPDSASHSPDELADAGFFYAGFGDCVRCFYCGIGLRHWTQDDNPWIEHARWAKNCVFVKQKKGDEFINLVQLAVQYSQDNASQENTAANQLSPREIENYLLSDASQSVLEMGYQPRIIKKAIENILRQNRQTEITAQFLMEQVLALEEAGNSTQAAPATPVAYVGPTEGALASAPKQSANAKSNDKESGNATRKTVVEEKKKDEKKTTKQTNGKAKETGSDDAVAQDPKAIKAENEQLKEQTLCKICLDQTVSIVFLPCGHLVTCADCAPAMRKCPICRALVKGTVRTYMS